MAIKIPSKNIYEMNNPKIRDNVIDNVSVEQTIVKPNNEYEVTVYNEKFYNIELTNKETTNDYFDNSKYDSGGSGQTAQLLYSVSYVAYNNQKLSEFLIKIPLVQNNNYIQRLYNGKDGDGENGIKYTIYGNIEKGSCIGRWNLSSKGEIVYKTPTSFEENVILSFPKELEQSENTYSPTITSSAQVKINDLSQLNNDYSVVVENEKEYYNLKVSILCGLRTIAISGATSWIGASGQQKPTSVDVSGEYMQYNPKNIEITIYGDTIGIDLTDGSITCGSGNKPHYLSGNELLQDSAKTIIKKSVQVTIGGELSSYSGTSFIEMFSDYKFNVGDEIEYNNEIAEISEVSDDYYEIKAKTNGEFYNKQGKKISIKKQIETLLVKELANSVLRQYSNGKETATLLCDIADYYNENGEKVIDIKTNNMSFRLHDEVIPYVFGANGQDQPMSKNADGSPKIFEVVGTNIIYDGAVWQELTLLEKH